MQRKPVIVFVVALALLGAAVVSYRVLQSRPSDAKPAHAEPTPVSATTTKQLTVRLKWIIYAGWAGELLASDRDLWKGQGLDVRLIPGGFDLDPIRLIAGGDGDIGIAGADQILLARQAGVPVQAFAVQYHVSPVGFAVHADSTIRTVGDFAGKKVGVKRGTDVDPIYRSLLALKNVEPSAVQEIPVKFDLAPFFSRDIDVYPGYLTGDLLIPAERDVPVRLISAASEGVAVYGNVYFAREDFIRQHPDTVRSFLRVLRETWPTALAMAPADIAAIAVKANDTLDSKHEARVAESLDPYVLPHGIKFGEMKADEWQRLYELLRSQGVLTKDFNWREAYTLSFSSPQ